MLPRLHKGKLSQYGYSLQLGRNKRYEALRRAVAAEGKATIIRRLNAIRILSKSNNKEAHTISINDIHFLEQM